MGFIYSIQICEISHQIFVPNHRKCPTCPMIFVNTAALNTVPTCSMIENKRSLSIIDRQEPWPATNRSFSQQDCHNTNGAGVSWTPLVGVVRSFRPFPVPCLWKIARLWNEAAFTLYKIESCGEGDIWPPPIFQSGNKPLPELSQCWPRSMSPNGVTRP